MGLFLRVYVNVCRVKIVVSKCFQKEINMLLRDISFVYSYKFFNDVGLLYFYGIKYIDLFLFNVQFNYI